MINSNIFISKSDKQLKSISEAIRNLLNHKKDDHYRTLNISIIILKIQIYCRNYVRGT